MTTPSPFSLPDGADEFVENVYNRADSLVRARIWTGLTQVRIRQWRANFHDRLEQYFGGCVLDALIYRSQAQTEALARHLFYYKLPCAFSRDSRVPASAVADVTAIFDGSTSGSIAVVPVVHPDELGKSGHIVLRLLQKKLGLAESCVTPVDKLRRTTAVVVFVDDFLGSGIQFSKLARRYQLDQLFADAFCVYAPLAAHEAGVTLLRRRYPNLAIMPCETLTGGHSLFSRRSKAFSDGKNSPRAAKSFYQSIRAKYGIPRGWAKGTSGHLATTYAFEHAVPNNNIEILWARCVNWTPLFDR